MDSAHLAIFLQALAKSIHHTVGLPVLIAAKLTQIRKEAVIGTSKNLTEESKDFLRKIPYFLNLSLKARLRYIRRNLNNNRTLS